MELSRDCLRLVVAHVHNVPTLLALRRVSAQFRSDLLPAAICELDLSSFFPKRDDWFDGSVTRRPGRRRCLLAATFQLFSFFPFCSAVSVRDCIVSTEELNRCLSGLAFAKLLPVGTFQACDLSWNSLHALAAHDCFHGLSPARHPLSRVTMDYVVFVGSGCLCCRGSEERFCLKLWKALRVPKGGATLTQCSDDAEGDLIKNATVWFGL